MLFVRNLAAGTARFTPALIVAMTLARKFVFSLCVCVLMLTVGCDQIFHKKKAATLPPRAQAPTIALNLPDGIPVPAEPAPVTVAQEPPKSAEPTPPPKPRRRSSKKPTPGTPSTSSPTAAGGTTTVAANRPPEPPPEANTAIAADVSSATAAKDKQTTFDLLDSAEKTIKGLDDHSLTDDQKAMVSQIWSYIAQSRKATIDGDIERALNLATKAHLLSDALIKK